MCITSNLQKHIRNLTNDGEVVARFLVGTVEGKYPGAKYHHKLEATKHLIRFGFTGEEQSQFWGLIPTPEELAAAKSRHSREACPRPRSGNGNLEGQGGETENSKLTTVNSLDILNYDIAHLIRTETADGHTIAEFLSDVMTRRDKPFTPKKLRIRHTDRMAAAREILRRGFGHFGKKRKLIVDAGDDDIHDANAYDTLHTDLAKRMREYSEHGTDAVRFLLDVMEDANPDDSYTWHHRMSAAAMELLRRGWDTNYDADHPRDAARLLAQPAVHPPLRRSEKATRRPPHNPRRLQHLRPHRLPSPSRRNSASRKTLKPKTTKPSPPSKIVPSP